MWRYVPSLNTMTRVSKDKRKISEQYFNNKYTSTNFSYYNFLSLINREEFNISSFKNVTRNR